MFSPPEGALHICVFEDGDQYCAVVVKDYRNLKAFVNLQESVDVAFADTQLETIAGLLQRVTSPAKKAVV